MKIATTTTSSTGFYSFTGLIPSVYTVEVIKPTGFDNITLKSQGTDTTKDSNLNSTSKTDPVTLVSGQNDMTIDAGFYKLASINGNGKIGNQNTGNPKTGGSKDLTPCLWLMLLSFVLLLIIKRKNKIVN